MNRILLTTLLAGLVFGHSLQAGAAAPRVVASLKPLHSLASALMEGIAAPSLLVEGSASEHSYTLRPSEARALQEADLVIWVGPVMEDYLIRPIAALPKGARVLTLIDLPSLTRLPLRRGGAFEADADEPFAGYDGHIWLDPQNARTIAQAIAARLQAIDPPNAARYARNGASLDAALAVLQDELGRRLAPLREKPLIVFHDAYHYLEARYGLNVVGAITLSPETPASAKRVGQIRARIKALGDVCVFAEPQFEPRLVATLVEGTQARRGVLDPLGAALAPGAQEYFVLLRNLATGLESCSRR